ASVAFSAKGGAGDGTTILGEASGAEAAGAGSPRYVVDVDIERAQAEIVRRIAAAISGAGVG
ncbi:MAG TPA: hypothetical protein VK054_09140, partial [Beutenbergiaceae bacterium]|nr:hypothetical protein [Beutenbergiaceae bacterium]